MNVQEVFVFERKQKTLARVETLDRMVVFSRDIAEKCFMSLRPGQWFTVSVLPKHYLFYGLYCESQELLRIETWKQFTTTMDAIYARRRKATAT